MKCPNCDVNFCFCCLTLGKKSGGCTYETDCKIAPRQQFSDKLDLLAEN